MNILNKIFRFCLALLEMLTDWFLIAIGLLICIKALIAVDLPVAKYVLAAIGIGLSGGGIWFRHKRLGQRK